MHLRILQNFLLKFAIIALPAIGILRAHSVAWNVVWWLIYLGVGIMWSRYELISNTVIGTMWAQIPFLILLEANIRTQVLWIVAGLWAGIAYWYIYREAVLLNRAATGLATRHV